MRFLLLLFLLCLFCGCSLFLPSGDPPPGNILTNQEIRKTGITNVSEIADYFISSLTMALLENCPGEKIALQTDPASAAIARKIFRASAAISGNQASGGKSRWILQTLTSGKQMQMRLSDGGKTVWQDKVSFDFDPANLL